MLAPDCTHCQLGGCLGSVLVSCVLLGLLQVLEDLKTSIAGLHVPSRWWQCVMLSHLQPRFLRVTALLQVPFIIA